KNQLQLYSQHQHSLINMLSTYKKSVRGYIVGIEAEKIHFSLYLSEILQEKFLNTCEQISEFIYQNIRGI
ncbi:MAG: hypothetical protein WC151_10470, partial [Bacteroidales bacterium]